MYVIPSVENNPKIRLGLCCINNGLRKDNIFCSRTVISRLYTKSKATDLTCKNLTDLSTILEWNSKNNINVYRMSSDMFPRITDENIPEFDRLKVSDFKEYLHSAGAFAKETNQRLTMHPSQFNQVGAISQSVYDRTYTDLQIHAEIMDIMGIDENGIITVHGGGVYSDKENTMRRWIEQFSDLPRSVKNRLCIEHCERQYNIEDCLYIAKECKIPVIFDSHHFDCYNQIHGTEFKADDYILPVLESWGDRRMDAHISEQKQSARIGAHSDFIETIPSYFLNIPEKYGLSIDIEVEAKAKELAIKQLLIKYSL